MIGDWVSFRNIYGQLKQEQVDLINCRELKPRIYTKYDAFYKKEDDIEPIPLTKEILKTNGFRSLGHGEYILEEPFVFEVRIYLRDTGNVFKIFNKDTGNIRCNVCHICHQDSVHELQHALRLCGLNELADDFKVND